MEIDLSKLPECHEGPKAFNQFRDAMKNVLAVPHSEIQRRIAAEKERSALNPNRRGPKPKRKRAGRAPGA
jgi:hypothetical protein